MHNDQPLDTTMGFTPTGGDMRGTRCGDLDPGVLIHRMHDKSDDAGKIEDLVNHQAGLLGVSGLSPDMETLLEQRSREPHAAQAVEIFCYQLRKHIGALTAVLGGLDTLVFTGGIGERAAPVRWEVCRGLAYVGIALDPQQNAVHADVISTPLSAGRGREPIAGAFSGLSAQPLPAPPSHTSSPACQGDEGGTGPSHVRA